MTYEPKVAKGHPSKIFKKYIQQFSNEEIILQLELWNKYSDLHKDFSKKDIVTDIDIFRL